MGIPFPLVGGLEEESCGFDYLVVPSVAVAVQSLTVQADHLLLVGRVSQVSCAFEKLVLGIPVNSVAVDPGVGDRVEKRDAAVDMGSGRRGRVEVNGDGGVLLEDSILKEFGDEDAPATVRVAAAAEVVLVQGILELLVLVLILGVEAVDLSLLAAHRRRQHVLPVVAPLGVLH